LEKTQKDIEKKLEKTQKDVEASLEQMGQNIEKNLESGEIPDEILELFKEMNVPIEE